MSVSRTNGLGGTDWLVLLCGIVFNDGGRGGSDKLVGDLAFLSHSEPQMQEKRSTGQLS